MALRLSQRKNRIREPGSNFSLGWWFHFLTNTLRKNKSISSPTPTTDKTIGLEQQRGKWLLYTQTKPWRKQRVTTPLFSRNSSQLWNNSFFKKYVLKRHNISRQNSLKCQIIGARIPFPKSISLKKDFNSKYT